MTLVKDIRKTVTDTNPVFVAVGVTDLAVERLRDARARGAAVRHDLTPSALQETYADLAVRGHKLVTRLRNQKSTQDLLAQAGSTVSLGKGAVTTVRRAAAETERSAKATLTTGRHQAEAVRDAVVSSVKDEADTTAEVAKKSAAATRTSARRTATTAKKSTAAAKRVTKSTATSATRTAAAAAKAAKVATPKIGD